MLNYIPPFDMTDEMRGLLDTIDALLAKIDAIGDVAGLEDLEHTTRIESIRSSLAIEGNALSKEQVYKILLGTDVLALREDILALNNAIRAYDMLDAVDATKLDELLRVHGVMMRGLMAEPGRLRRVPAGVYGSNGEVLYIAPPHDKIKAMCDNLFNFINRGKVSPIIKSCIFHYELELIHPFKDGSGRMGRLWQTALLMRYNKVFKYVPIERVIKHSQLDYYNAIRYSSSEKKENKFVIYMLGVIRSALEIYLDDIAKLQK